MTIRGTLSRSTFKILPVLILVTTLTPVAADVMLDTTAQLSQANVTFLLPHALKVGESPVLDVRVEPAEGQPTPTRVRGRIGMPDMGHWVTEESGVDFSSAGHQFGGEFPHPGVYRFRIWIDYSDGTTIKTAIDFTLATGYELAPEVVP